MKSLGRLASSAEVAEAEDEENVLEELESTGKGMGGPGAAAATGLARPLTA